MHNEYSLHQTRHYQRRSPQDHSLGLKITQDWNFAVLVLAVVVSVSKDQTWLFF